MCKFCENIKKIEKFEDYCMGGGILFDESDRQYWIKATWCTENFEDGIAISYCPRCGRKMCKYCDEPYENMSVSAGYIKIRKSKYSPSGYSLCADTSGGEYGEADCPVWHCPMCGRNLTEE